MNKINYVDDDEDKIALHFVKASRQVINLAVRTYVDDDITHIKIVRAKIKAKIIKLQADLNKY